MFVYTCYILCRSMIRLDMSRSGRSILFYKFYKFKACSAKDLPKDRPNRGKALKMQNLWMNPNLNQVLWGHQLQHTHFHSHNSEKIEYNMHDHHCRMFELHDEQLKTLCLVGSDLQNVQGNPAIIPIMLIFIRHESDFMQFLTLTSL